MFAADTRTPDMVRKSVRFRDGSWPRTAGRGRCLESPSKMATPNASARTPPIVLLPDPDAPIATTGGAFGIEELPTLIAMSGHSAQEGFSSILSVVVEDLCGAAGLHDETLVHEDDPIRDLARETHFVRNDHHRHSLVGEALHDRKDVSDCFRVQRRRRFIKKHDCGIHRERTGNSNTLLLAAGQCAWVTVRLIGQT